MKHLIYTYGIILILLISACNKEETTSDQFPEWLQAKITELTSEQNICSITDVTIIEYNGKTYYHVYCGFWSCVYCEFFDEKGNHPNWDTNVWNDFHAKQKVIKILPACQ